MALIKLKLDSASEIIAKGWANPTKRKAGDTTADGFTVYDLADAEAAKIVLGHSKLTGSTVTVDADYVAPADPEPEAPQPSADMQAIALLTKQLATAKADAAAAQQTATMAQTATVALTKEIAALKGAN